MMLSSSRKSSSSFLVSFAPVALLPGFFFAPAVFRLFVWQKVGFVWQKVGICICVLTMSKKVRIFASSFKRERATQGCDPQWLARCVLQSLGRV